jgi:hypothetical protein
MTDLEFANACAGPLEAAYGGMDVSTVRMYRSFTDDMDPETLAAAVAKCVAEMKWRPKIAEIRQAAVDIVRGQFQEASAGEAWKQAQVALRTLHPDLPDSAAKARESVPGVVWEALQAAGVRRLQDSAPAWAEKAFREAYIPIAAREQKRAMALPSVRAAIEQNQAKQLSAATSAAVAKIGVEDKGA